MKTRSIVLPNGNKLEINVTKHFLELVKEYFKLSTIKDINDDHLRVFLYSTTKSAIDKAESQIK